MAKFDKLSDSRVRIEIEVTKEMFEHGLDHAFEAVRKDVEIKGFRKGKVTRKIYEQHRGVESLYEEALNHIIQDTYYDAIVSEKLDAVAQPKIDLDMASVERGKDFTYTATVAVKPEVTLGQYSAFEYEADSHEVSEEEVQKKIESLRQQNAELIIKEDGTLENGDTAVFDFEGFLEGVPFEGGKAENHQLVLGSGQFIPGFEEQMVGMKTEDAREITVTFPEEYQAENLKGKEAVFKIKLHEIKQKRIPELNDAFVKDLDKEGIETVEQLLEDTRKTLENDKIKNNRNKAVDFVVDTASQHATMTIPKEMIEEEQNRQLDNVKRQAQQYNIDFDTYLSLTGTDKDTFMDNLTKQAEKSIRYHLTVEAVAAKEKIAASKEDIETKYDEFAKQYNMDVEQIRTQVNPQAVEQEVIFGKTIDFLVDSLIRK